MHARKHTHPLPLLHRARHPQMVQLVTEKDSGLRQAMRTMGLLESSYWGSWIVFDLAFGTVLTLAIIASGACGTRRLSRQLLPAVASPA